MHYLYIYLDPRKPGRFTYGNLITFFAEPIYVGKGKNDRAYSHLREVNWNKSTNNIKSNKIKSIIRSGIIPEIWILEQGPEQHILSQEETFINAIGRVIDDAGPLTNIRNSNWTRPKVKNSRTGNHLFGKRFTTITDGTNTFRCEDQYLQQYVESGFKIIEWQRPKKNNSKSRSGSNNPMSGKSAVAGRKWITTDDGTTMMLSQEQIDNISGKFSYGRSIDKNKRKRIIIRNTQHSRYMSDDDIAKLPAGTEYQVGLLWKVNKKTYIV